MIEPQGDRGRIDLILDQTATTRKYLEAKVFDSRHRDRAYLVSGFGQLLHYLVQHNGQNGYLLVYKTCLEHLVIDGAMLLDSVPFVTFQGRRIYVITVDICQDERPPSERPCRQITISVDEIAKSADNAG